VNYHIGKTYTDGEDIATALEILQDIDVKEWKPRIETSIDLDDQIIVTEQINLTWNTRWNTAIL